MSVIILETQSGPLSHTAQYFSAMVRRSAARGSTSEELGFPPADGGSLALPLDPAGKLPAVPPDPVGMLTGGADVPVFPGEASGVVGTAGATDVPAGPRPAPFEDEPSAEGTVASGNSHGGASSTSATFPQLERTASAPATEIDQPVATPAIPIRADFDMRRRGPRGS